MIDLGLSCRANILEELHEEVFRLQQQGEIILSFQDFEHLLKTQILSVFSKSLPASIQALDPVLNAPPETIREKTTLSVQEYKQLRTAFLLKKHHEKTRLRILHEEAILNRIRAKEAVSLLDYTGYLSQFFASTFTLFFSQRAFKLKPAQLKAHSYVCAGAGHGKSELVKRLIFGVMEAGESAIILDPHGDLALQVAHWWEFAKDPERLIYFDPYSFGGNLDFVPVLNPLATLKNPVNRDSVVSGFIDTMTSVIDEKDAPSDRMKSILKACLYTFAGYGEEVNLYDLIDFLGDGEKADFWKNQARQILKNQALLAMVNDFDKKEYGNTKTAIRDRLRVLLASDVLDKCLIGENSINLAEAMNSGKIIVFNLAKGQLGRDSSNAFGRFLLAGITAHAMQRQSIKKDERKPVFLFMDEGDNYMSQNVIEIYKETRKYGLFITFIQQVAGYGMSLEQWRAIRTNSLLRFAGNVGGDSDGLKIVSEMMNTTKEDVLSLPRGNFWMKYGMETPQKFRVGLDLVDFNHSMTPQEWEQVKELQKEKYYRATHEQKPRPAPPDQVATTTTTKKPLNFDLN